MFYHGPVGRVQGFIKFPQEIINQIETWTDDKKLSGDLYVNYDFTFFYKKIFYENDFVRTLKLIFPQN